jgi:hypothetical protein
VYHPDAIEEHGPVVGSPLEFLESMKDDTMSPERRPLPVQHVITNTSFEIHGDVAYGESYCEVRRVDEQGGMFIEGFARLVDRFERREGEWRIAHRRALLEYGGGPGGKHALDEWLSGTRDRSDPSYERDAGHV